MDNSELFREAWGINPATVYGFLIVVLILGLTVFAYVIRIIHREKKEERKEYMDSVKEHSSSIADFNQSVRDMNRIMIEHKATTDKFIDLLKDKL